MALQHLRSSTASKRPLPAGMSDGQLAINTNTASPGLFFKDSAGALIKVGPVHVGTTAPNASPASGGQTGNTVGEQWLDTTGGGYVFKVWDGSAWRSETGEFVNVNGDTMTGDLVMNNANIVFEGATADDFETTLTVTDPTADRTITLPDVSGTVVTTGDTGSVTSTMIADGAIVDADINASAEIAVSKLADGTARQLLQTDAAGTGVEWTSNIDVPGTLDVTGAAVFDSSITAVGDVTLNAQADLRFADSDSSNWVALQAPATVASNVTWTLPNADGTSGQVLSTDGAGALSWTSSAGSGDKIEEGNTSAEVIDTGSDGRFVVTTEGVEALRVDSSQRVGIGTTAPTFASSRNGITVRASSANGVEFLLQSTSATDATSAGYATVATGNDVYHVNRLDGFLAWVTGSSGNTERMRLDSSGRLLVGTSSSRNLAAYGPAGLQVESTGYANASISAVNNENTADGVALILGKSRGTSIGSNTIVQSGDQIGSIWFQGADGSAMRAGANILAFVDGTPGASDMPGRLVFSTTADGASSPTERMRIDSSGRVMIPNGVSTSPEDNSGTNGITFACTTGSYAQFAKIAGSVAGFNRMTNDGTIIRLMQAGTEEGTISVSGTTVSYNGAHLSRWSQLPSGAERTEILRGSVLSNIDEMCEWGDEENEQLNRMKVSDVEGDKNVSGVFQSWDDDDDTYTNDFYCAMTGDFIIRIAAGVTVERGDLLMSAGDGTAKPQDDDIIRSKTIAKVTSTNVSCTYDDGSYCVPCVLMAC